MSPSKKAWCVNIRVGIIFIITDLKKGITHVSPTLKILNLLTDRAICFNPGGGVTPIQQGQEYSLGV